jgi:hypothetical protein
MGNAITLDSRALWLTLRDHGGWWSAHHLAEHWSPTFHEREISEHLRALHAGGFVAQSHITVYRTQVPTYAVTDLCRALPGCSLSTASRSTTPEGAHA